MNKVRNFGVFVLLAMLFGIASANPDSVGATGVAIDLGDIVGGGDGSGTGVHNTGIDARTGNIAGTAWAGNGDTGTSEYDAVPSNPLVDGVFVPKSGSSATTIATTGLTFLFPSTNGLNWDAIRNGVSTLETNQDVNPIYDEGGNVIDVGVGLHANAGVTFDLDAIRALNPSSDIVSFTGNVGGIPSPTRCGSGTAIAHVLLDGNEVFSKQVGNTAAQSTVFALPIAPTDRFLTLATTDIGSYGCDKAYFGNALLNIESNIPAGLVSWWPGDGNAEDVAGTNDGTLVNGATYAPGIVGQAFSLDGIDDYIDVGPGYDLDAMTLDAWVFINTATNTGDRRIISKDNGLEPGTRKLFALKSSSAYWNNGNNGRASFEVLIGGTIDVASAPSALTAGWHHLSGVRDTANGRFEVYVDCELVASKTPTVSGPIDSPGPTVIGQVRGTYNNSQGAEFFNGLIDEAKIYNRALSAAEIQANCNEPPTADADNDPVTVNEGDSAANSGTVSDLDGDTVTLTASVGTVTNNNDDTWSWNFDTSDGPAESQTVTIDADDNNGGTAQTTFELIVKNVAPTVETITVPTDPIDVNDQPVTGVSATFSDPAGINDESYTCTVDYDDGSGPQAGTVAGTTCTGPNQTYAEAGVYAVTVTVTDKDTSSGSATATEFIVLYDPSGGFVTGGGWIDSPVNTDFQYMQVAGKAGFGFVAKYKKGANVPDGNTQFQFKAGDLNFHSSSYEWLVAAGDTAMFRGEGTINGEGSYTFMIWAGDDSPDTFRIKIWGDNGTVYDNGSQQALGGGSIKIHDGK